MMRVSYECREHHRQLDEDDECSECEHKLDRGDPDLVEAIEWCESGRCGDCDACYQRAEAVFDRVHGGGL